MHLHLKPAILMLLVWTVLTGVVYPAAVTAVAHLFFPAQATGSLITESNGKTVGSRLIGQNFTDPGYFWGRPAATTPHPYNAGASSGSNQGPTNPGLFDAVRARIAALTGADPDNPAPIPVDLVTASASGLDPHISLAAAEYQLHRVAQSRHMDQNQLRDLVAEHTEGRTWGVLGEPRVNVLELNLALDSLR
jgi:K+-transporting ATPase ATPase C chain